MGWKLPKWVVWIDRQVQRVYDKFFHALMRLGITKRQIRWNLWVIYIIAFCVHSYLLFSGWALLFGLFSALNCFVMYGLAMQRDHDADREVENRPGTRSRADNPFFGSIYKTVGWFFVGLYAPGILFQLDVFKARDAWCATHCLAMLSQGYLVFTTPILPKPKEKKANAEFASPAHVGAHGHG